MAENKLHATVHGTAAPAAGTAAEAEKPAVDVHTIVDPWKTLKPDATLAERFAAYQARLSKNHPLYTIESREVGKAPVGHKMVIEPPKHGKKGGFSTTFTGGNYEFSGLQTAATKHRYLSELDG
jgi:hypothetical protein